MITITTTERTIKAIFSAEEISVRPKSSIHIDLLTGKRKGSYIEIGFSSGEHWTFDMNGARGKPVTVNGATPKDNDGLLLMLEAII